MNSQSGNRIAGLDARDAERKAAMAREPKILVALPASLVQEMASMGRSSMVTIGSDNPIVEACRTAMGGFDGNR